MANFVGNVVAEGQIHLVASTLFGVCNTDAATAEKSVEIANFDTLLPGVTIHVKFTQANTASNITLAVNTAPAKPVYYRGQTSPGRWLAGTVVSFTYDASDQSGGCWRMNDIPLLDTIWPVGSIYMSVNSTNPGSLFGGTWEQLKDKFLLGAGTTYANGSTGGAATVTLATANLPAHNHGMNSHVHAMGSHTHTVPAHTHDLNSHSHAMGSHSHGLGSHTHSLNNHTHTVPKHSHGLNSHKHSIPVLSGSTNSTGGHQHKANDWLLGSTKNWVKHMDLWGVRVFINDGTGEDIGAVSSMKNKGYHNDDEYASKTAGAHSHTVTTVANTTGAASGSTAEQAAVNTTAATGNTGAASGNTAATALGNTGAVAGTTKASAVLTSSSAALGNTGAASGTTANTGSGTAHNNMPPYLTVYMWKRTA